MTKIQGIGVGSGKAWGRVFLLEKPSHAVLGYKSSLDPLEELARLESAILEVLAELEDKVQTAEQVTGEIVSALMLVLQDPALLVEAQKYLTEGWNAETALSKAMDSFTSQLAGIAGFEDRIPDLEGLVELVIAKIGPHSRQAITEDGPLVIVAEDLTPLDTLNFNESVVGVITKNGGPTSHAAIICRHLGIPALVALTEGYELLTPNLGITIDALLARAFISEVSEIDGADEVENFELNPIIPVLANIGSAADAIEVSNYGVSGVGLFRTELLFLDRANEPSIAQQQEEYEKAFAAFKSGELIVRTLDVSVDKPIPFLESALPVLNQNVELLTRQLKAIKQAADSSQRDVSVMAPMIRSKSEVECFSELARDVGFSKVGIMIETLEFIEEIEKLEGLVDFLSIGTNDLSSELFGQDRLKPQNPELLDPWQPGLLRIIAQVVDSAKDNALKVGVCGEAAADPNLAAVLAGLGVDSVSTGSGSIRAVGVHLTRVSKEQAIELSKLALEADSADQAKRAVAAFLQGIQG